jgi:Uma2 family endonuclease
MATTARRLTLEDLEALPEEHPGDRHELIDGELFVSPVPLLNHQIVSMNLVRALDRHVVDEQLGMVFSAPTGVRLAEDTLVIPDVCFVSRSRLQQLGAKGVVGPPDLIVEILSPGTRRRDLGLKRALYRRFKVPEYWIVDPDEQSVTGLTLTDDRYEVVPVSEDGMIRSRVLPGLKLPIEQVFADVI